MHPIGDPSLPPFPPNVEIASISPGILPPLQIPPSPPPDLAPEPKTPRAKRDTRFSLPKRDLLRTTRADNILYNPPPSTQEGVTTGLGRLVISERAPSADPRAVLSEERKKDAEELEALALFRLKVVDQNNKKEFHEASKKYLEKAQQLACGAFQLLKESDGKGPKVEQGFSLLREVLVSDKFGELDDSLFKMLTETPGGREEELVCLKLQEWIKETVNKAESKTILRSDSDWEQKLLRVMHNGYLSGLLKKLDKEISKIRTEKYLKHSVAGDTLKVKKAGLEAYQCIARVRIYIDKMPLNLVKLYAHVYESVKEKYKDEAFANEQLVQFVFLRAVNPHIAKAHDLARYKEVAMPVLEEETKKLEQCVLIARIIQTAIGRIKVQGEEKEDRTMVMKDKSGLTLLDFVRLEKNHQEVLALASALKARIQAIR